MSEIPFPPLKLAQSHYRSLLPSSLYVDHSHCPVLAPATLAALPSTRAIPDRDVFYVASPNRLILRSPHTARGIHQHAEIRSDQKKEKFKNRGASGWPP